MQFENRAGQETVIDCITTDWSHLKETDGIKIIVHYLHCGIPCDFRKNEWTNEWCIYIALYCVLLYTQSSLQSCVCVGGGGGGVSLQPPPVCSIHLDDATAPVRSPHTSYRWRGEKVIEPIKCMGIIRRSWLMRASGGNLARTPGLHPYSFTRSAMGFLVTTESQDLGLTSHPKDGAFWQYSVPITILGH